MSIFPHVAGIATIIATVLFCVWWFKECRQILKDGESWWVVLFFTHGYLLIGGFIVPAVALLYLLKLSGCLPEN